MQLYYIYSMYTYIDILIYLYTMNMYLIHCIIYIHNMYIYIYIHNLFGTLQYFTIMIQSEFSRNFGGATVSPR